MTISSIREQIIVPLNGYPNYFINSFGFVFRKAHEVIRENGFVHSLKELQLARYIDSEGYWAVDIKTKHYRLHRLLAEHFISNPENKRTVNHKDGNKWNLDLANLEWATDSENNQHAYDMGLRVGYYKGKHSPASKPICIKDKEGQIIGTYASINHAAINVGLHRGTIEKCLKNQRRHRFKRWTFHAL